MKRLALLRRTGPALAAVLAERLEISQTTLSCLVKTAGHDVVTAARRPLQVGGRTFLEVHRFDRHGAIGRFPLMSWFAVNAALVCQLGRPPAQSV